MKSEMPGTSTFSVEVSHVSQHGIWLLCEDKEYHLPFEKFPWFKKATIEQIHNVKRLTETHLYWEELDVDLSLPIIEDPEKFSLISKH